MALGVDQALYKLLSSDGTSTGTLNMNVDGGTPATFYRGPASGHTWALERINFNIEDAVATISPHLFGGIAALTNGIQLLVQRDGATALDFSDGLAVKNNADFGLMAGVDVAYRSSGNAANTSAVAIRFTFGKAGQPLILSGSRAERIALVVSDDLTDLEVFTAQLQGYEVS